MQLRSTTPSLSATPMWLAAVIILTGLSIVGSAYTVTAESNTDRQSRIDALTKQINTKVSSTRQLNTQSDNIQSQLGSLKKERDYLQAEIQKNNSDQQSLEEKISVTEKTLAAQRSLLGTVMANMYLDDSISPLEMLASSGSIADFLDAQTIRETLKSQLNQSIEQVKSAEKQLVAQKKELIRIAGDQQNQHTALGQKASEQDRLLVATQGQSGELIKITAAMAAERKQLQETQQQVLSAGMSGATQVPAGTISQPATEAIPAPTPTPTPQVPSPSQPPAPSTPAPPTPAPAPPVVLPNGGYPSYLQNCYVDSNALSYGIDPWGYGCRQCVSYTAWKVLQKTGRPAMYWGNAKDWPRSAGRVGYGVGTEPRRQSVAVMTTGTYGHVAWVESINSNGTLNVSQYNYWLSGKSNGGWGWYSEFRNVSPRTYQYYIYV